MPNLIGTAPDQVPVNGFLGNMAFQNKEGVVTDLLSTTALTVTGTIATSLGSAAAPSYTFIGDTNTGIFSPAADTIAFSEGGAEVMRINSSGNVGIGTSAPSNLLTLRKDTAGFEQISVSESGGYKATFGLGYSATDTFSIKVNSTGGTVRTPFQYGAGVAGGLTIDATSEVATNFIAMRTTGAERMRITAAGNVGIGVTAPNSKLEIKGTNTNAGIYLEATSNSVGFFGAYSAYFGAGSAADLVVGGYSGSIVFANSAAERMRIDSSGNLLVGTTSAGTSAAKVIGMANATAPTTSPAGMGQLYVEGGALKFRGLSGTVTTIAPA